MKTILWKAPMNKWLEFPIEEIGDFDKEEYRHVPLKEGERLIRYKTEGYAPLIKVNEGRGLLYFLKDYNADSVEFEGRGLKCSILNRF